MSPLAYSLGDAAKVVGVSRGTLLTAVHAGHLKAKRTSRGGNGEGSGYYLVSADALREWFDGLVDA